MGQGVSDRASFVADRGGVLVPAAPPADLPARWTRAKVQFLINLVFRAFSDEFI